MSGCGLTSTEEARNMGLCTSCFSFSKTFTLDKLSWCREPEKHLRLRVRTGRLSFFIHSSNQSKSPGQAQSLGRSPHTQLERIAQLQKGEETGLLLLSAHALCRAPGCVLDFSKDCVKYINASVSVRRCRERSRSCVHFLKLNFIEI